MNRDLCRAMLLCMVQYIGYISELLVWFVSTFGQKIETPPYPLPLFHLQQLQHWTGWVVFCFLPSENTSFDALETEVTLLP